MFPANILRGFSLEIIAKDIDRLEDVAPLLARGTQISITSLGNEDAGQRVRAARRIRDLGFVAVPHIAARRVTSEAELAGIIDAFGQAGVDSCLVIAGDLPRAVGPYDDALAIIQSGLLEEAGFRRVAVSGYPEGHPHISDPVLMRSLRDKLDALGRAGIEPVVMTQFGFSADPILAWVARLRRDGFAEKIRIGVPGPASLRTLLRFAAQCGVGASTKVIGKYGLATTQLLKTAGPDVLVQDLSNGLERAHERDVAIHFFPFGGLAKTLEWIESARAAYG
ncbi:5,10-methylenetetrahydrofolate reductase [Rhizorhabdus dicambivorans]|uniref:Methylenetetrahydrofolate reductase n=2 Tax=Rhizorhabdus dicambivorans TaxID=1850238 RepID=A0A2A4FR24_9SPHN|nr:5,10-methylenetetrahydrofolate reductase [Rhizorhabdus dicambivorans]PCE39898.1 5,10-methylenetetrahydrofolate reductase [Rhizorhabdus dicambivorans]